MPKTGETIYMVMNNGKWEITNNPNYWRKLSYYVMECYITNASEKWEAW